MPDWNKRDCGCELVPAGAPTYGNRWRLCDKHRSVVEELGTVLGEPVVPLNEFCWAITTWFRCIEQANVAGDPHQHGHDYAAVLSHVELDIRKSNLLGRLIYGGQALRTEPCPEHNGHWTGSAMLEGCPHGCHGTGWLPARPEDGSYTGGILLVKINAQNVVTEVVGPPDQARKL
jgi:hypothetical protein